MQPRSRQAELPSKPSDGAAASLRARHDYAVKLVAATCLVGAAIACAAPVPAPLLNGQPPTATPSPAPTATPFPTSTPFIVPTNTPIDTGSIAPWPVLKRGDSGMHEVFALQRLLRQNGFTVYVTGNFGDQTLAAVKGAQAALGVPSDGRVDEDTWKGLVHDQQLQEGDRGEAVTAALYLLHEKFGYSVSSSEGRFGPEAAAALQDFQARFRLPATGIVDTLTWQALISIRIANEPYLSNPP